MDPSPGQTINFKIFEGKTLCMAVANSSLLSGLHLAAHRLTGAERLELIEKLQKTHAELEARYR
ncbi:hypothetical protein IFR09_11175 [Pseudomonas syringae]|nr:hypothetical protein [Pseudomonas syringae]MBD8790940.1 hypothetical protein [Pseudomonas syringae]MBD8801924.1 hypothetical protein [Pseudomonas syringae]MBD8811726.1 hypothetical protein [Pseudomonas syringae]